MRTSITRSMTFSAAHRLQHHLGDCKNLHGHNFKLSVTVSADYTRFGMIVELSDLGALLQKLHAQWDHALILENTDPLRHVLQGVTKIYVTVDPPTTETLAGIAYNFVNENLKKLFEGDGYVQRDYRVDSAHLQETDKNSAEVTFEDVQG